MFWLNIKETKHFLYDKFSWKLWLNQDIIGEKMGQSTQ